MTLLELQQILGERVLIAKDQNISAEDRRKENETSQTIASLAKQMINNADIVMRCDRLVAEGNGVNSNILKLVQGDGKQN